MTFWAANRLVLYALRRASAQDMRVVRCKPEPT